MGAPSKVQRVLFRPVVDCGAASLWGVQEEGDVSSVGLAVPLGVHGDGLDATGVGLDVGRLLQRLHVAESVPLARPLRLAVGQEAARDFALATALRTGIESRAPRCSLRLRQSREAVRRSTRVVGNFCERPRHMARAAAFHE